MNEIKNWLDAMESGNYEKGKEKFFKDGKYCAVGLFAKVNRPDLFDSKTVSIDIHYYTENYLEKFNLYELNDDTELSFPEMAREIRNNPERYIQPCYTKWVKTQSSST